MFLGDKKKTKKQSEETMIPRDKESIVLDLSSQLAAEPKIRVTGVYGDINEERCSETLYSLYLLNQSKEDVTFKEDEETGEIEQIETILPIDFYISTHGGSATEMFALYDVMRQVRDDCPIHTFGVGKVMSAGVLLLAAGTKGERKIGANCRVMIHGVISGQQGYLADIENEFEESKFIQELYINALAAETNMTVRYLKKLLQRKTNAYFNAKEAVEMGIADIII